MTTSAPPRPPRSTVDVDAIPTPLGPRSVGDLPLRPPRRQVDENPDAAEHGKNAKTNDPTTWSSFEDVLIAYEADPTLDGIGYIFAEDDPYCGVDIDKLTPHSERLTWALAIVERLGTYAEWSVSGNGLHIVGQGRMPDADGVPQKGRSDQTKRIEAYCEATTHLHRQRRREPPWRSSTYRSISTGCSPMSSSKRTPTSRSSMSTGPPARSPATDRIE